MIWYVLRPPHSACYMSDTDGIDDTTPRRRIASHVLDQPFTDQFPIAGVKLELPVARFKSVFRTTMVRKNTLKDLMMAVYLFYWAPIGTLAAIADVPEDGTYRKSVVDSFDRGGQPTWGLLIGKDATRDPNDVFMNLISEGRRGMVQASEGFCHGKTYFRCFRVVDENTLRLDCDS